MPLSQKSLLNDAIVCTALKHAWQDSNPGVMGGHEEGGFIAQDAANNLRIW